MNYILILALIFFTYYLHTINKVEYFLENTHVFNIYKIFETPQQIQRGLMFKKDSLPENSAALFKFKEPRNVSFWMKNTYIPLDLIYLDTNYLVIKLYENTKPLSLKSYKGKNVKYALEVNSGEIKKRNIKVNDKIIIN